MRVSNDGATVGITLRLPTSVYQAYAEIAKLANLIELQKGGKGRKTPQDVMRHRLATLPAVEEIVALNDGETVGITLRLPLSLYEAYGEIAKLANLFELQHGGKGMKTPQDVMRHQLATLPAVVEMVSRAKGDS